MHLAGTLNDIRPQNRWKQEPLTHSSQRTNHTLALRHEKTGLFQSGLHTPVFVVVVFLSPAVLLPSHSGLISSQMQDGKLSIVKEQGVLLLSASRVFFVLAVKRQSDILKCSHGHGVIWKKYCKFSRQRRETKREECLH